MQATSRQTPRPARINDDSGTPSLRAQLKVKRTSRAAVTPQRMKSHTKYRRTKSDAEVWAILQASRDGHGDAKLPQGKYAVDARTLCYIDGYNVIGAWPRLAKHSDRGDLDTARRFLIDDVGEFAHVRG